MYLFYGLLFFVCASAQYNLKTSPVYEEQRVQIMTLGTFHFGYPGLDTHKTVEDLRVDVLSAKRQEEIKLVLEKVKAFNPTKILIEWNLPRQNFVDSTYQEYVAGRFELKRNEVYQLGFRLAKELGHQTVYCIDDNGRFYPQMKEGWKEYSAKLTAWQANRSDNLSEIDWSGRFKQIYNENDRYKHQNTIIKIFRSLNDPDYVKESHGTYLTGTFDFEITYADFAGVDWFITNWYNRNLRMYRNMRRQIESKQERLLAIVGAGHLAILNHILEAAPDVEFISPLDYLNK